MESDITFIQMEASLYAAAARHSARRQYMNIVEAHYAKLKRQPPAAIDIQNAWLLYNTGNDRALYPALMRIGGRNDLTLAQRETVQDIWANWSVRRAGTAMDNGDTAARGRYSRRRLQSLPEQPLRPQGSCRRLCPAWAARREALAIFKTVPMQDATAGDFQGR